MHEHIPEMQGVTPTASHSANINLCRYLPERRWDQLPARNPGFVGRVELLAQMEDRCFGGACIGSGGLCVSLVLTNALTGSGGVGKSQSANEFAHRNLKVNMTRKLRNFVVLICFSLFRDTLGSAGGWRRRMWPRPRRS
jgi:hypothetical protein